MKLQGLQIYLNLLYIISKRSMQQWLTKRGKEGNQNKMPVILNESAIADWITFTGVSL